MRCTRRDTSPLAFCPTQDAQGIEIEYLYTNFVLFLFLMWIEKRARRITRAREGVDIAVPLAKGSE